MKRTASRTVRAGGLALAAISTLALTTAPLTLLAGPPGWKVKEPEPGGLIPRPLVTNLSGGQDLTVKWTGFGGPYQVETSPTVNGQTWTPVGSPTGDTTATVPIGAGNGFVRVNGAAPEYLGSDNCSFCHSAVHTSWSASKHAGALASLKAVGSDKNAACLPCHTTGYGNPTGYKDEATTPDLANVTCENCHGPGAAHAANPADLTKRPVIEMSAKMCGGCHNGFHHPTYDEWLTAGHSKVTPGVAASFVSGGAARELACGPCHSGAVRLTLLSNLERSTSKQRPTPDAATAGEISVTCAVCHDGHGSSNPRQLRNPTKSLAAFSYSTSTNTTFAAQYKADLNLCGQCHNLRGGVYTSGSRPPHHSPQYNMLIADGGVADATTPPTGPHRDAPDQCATCHTHRLDPATPTPENPVYTGHGFHVSLETCKTCHTSGAEGIKSAVQTEVQGKIDALKAKLDTWATTKAPAALTKYGKMAWEFTTAGALGNPTGASTNPGPSSTDQASVPDGIKKARFNLYLVFHDQSKGIHNPAYARYLLKVADDLVTAALAN